MNRIFRFLTAMFCATASVLLPVTFYMRSEAIGIHAALLEFFAFIATSAGVVFIVFLCGLLMAYAIDNLKKSVY